MASPIDDAEVYCKYARYGKCSGAFEGPVFGCEKKSCTTTTTTWCLMGRTTYPYTRVHRVHTYVHGGSGLKDAQGGGVRLMHIAHTELLLLKMASSVFLFFFMEDHGSMCTPAVRIFRVP